MTGRATGTPPRVLVVEDEMLIAMLVEDMLEELGYVVLGPASRLAEARAIIRDAAVDVAILDVNLDGEVSLPLADELAALSVPVVFATGYGNEVLADRFAGVPVLRKPFVRADLERALEATLGAPPRAG